MTELAWNVTNRERSHVQNVADREGTHTVSVTDRGAVESTPRFYSRSVMDTLIEREETLQNLTELEYEEKKTDSMASYVL